MRKILIVDDDPRNVFALSAVLRAKRCNVVAAENFQAAQKLLETNQIDFILLDMMMPGTDGYTALRVWKSDDRFRHVPIIAVTAQAMAGDREKCLASGADGYLPKPIDIDSLLDLVTHLRP